MTKLTVTRNYADWITPKASVKILEPELGTDSNSHIAKNTLLRRLRHGEIQAVAGTDKLYEIPASDWEEIGENDFLWTSGDVSFEWFAGSGYSQTRRTTTHFAVKFDPVAVRKLLPPGTAQTTVAAVVDRSHPPKPKDQKPVSRAALGHWYDAYKMTYVDDSEDRAIESAQRMFPDKVITRKNIRDLRGDRAMGRPKNEG